MRHATAGVVGFGLLTACLATAACERSTTTPAVPPTSAAAAYSPSAPAYAVTGRIAAPANRWDYASFDPVRRRLYVAAGQNVLTVDVDGGAVNGAFAKGVKLHSAFALPGGATVVTTNGDANNAELIDAGTGAVLATVPTGTKPDAAIFDPSSGLVLVMNGHSGDVTLIDPAAKKSVGTIAVGGALEFAAADGAGKAFVNVEDKNQIAVLDIAARKVVARYPLKGCQGPTGLAYDKPNDLLISACANGVAKVVRGASGAEIATLAIGKDPDAVIYDKSRSRAFIPCGGDGVLEVVAMRGPSDVAIVQSLATQKSARSGAVDEKTGRLYLPTAKFGPAQGGEDGPMIPGSFEILVVGPK
ncbi:MAG: YncE family protein [Caulobacteraceae bacterium]